MKTDIPVWSPIESSDGKWIYAIGGSAEGYTLVRTPLEGGEIEQVLNSLVDNYLGTVDDGIYFIPRPDPAGGYSIRFFELATGKIQTIAELGKRGCSGLSVSPDRRWALYTRLDQGDNDLMLVENFR